MIGDLIARIRKEKKILKTDLAKATNINIGHLSHIEYGERNPSHKALKSLCVALKVPCQPLMYTYDKNLTLEQKDYIAQNHIKYDGIPIFSSIDGFATCSEETQNATFVLKINNDEMSPKFKENSFVYVEMNTPLNNKDFGIFEVDNKLVIRKFIIRRNDIVLRAEKDGIDDIIVTKESNFNIIGKILGTYNR